MSKKNNQNARTSVEDLQARKAKLAAELAATDTQLADAERARIENIGAQIDTFPALLGVATLGEVASLIRQREKGTLGSVAQDVTRRARTVLTDEQRNLLVADRRAGMQYSALATKYGVSSQTAFNVCKEAGVTVSRDANAPAVAPAVAAS